MRNSLRWAVVSIVTIGLPLVATVSSADHDDAKFEPLSASHIDYGVSQYNYGIVPRSGGGPNAFVPAPMKLMNPSKVTQVAAVFVYNRSADPSQTEVFLGCVVRKVTPHGALDLLDESIGGDFPAGENTFFLPPGFPPRYAETIWAPLEKVKVKGKGSSKRRVADGLGGRSMGAVNATEHHLAHPKLFSLPSNKVVPGQRQAALDCVCSNLQQIGASSKTFKDFGVRCY